jgi:hypothetical protein
MRVRLNIFDEFVCRPWTHNPLHRLRCFAEAVSVEEELRLDDSDPMRKRPAPLA